MYASTALEACSLAFPATRRSCAASAIALCILVSAATTSLLLAANEARASRSSADSTEPVEFSFAWAASKRFSSSARATETACSSRFLASKCERASHNSSDWAWKEACAASASRCPAAAAASTSRRLAASAALRSSRLAASATSRSWRILADSARLFATASSLLICAARHISNSLLRDSKLLRAPESSNSFPERSFSSAWISST
mmetsp:Transcript_134963/g.288743  ORF Transcript_134963/g.288743 Transcript_134963/m.288743 type:complete len:204 (-) Transcript_134963:1184-1795(-)